MRMSTLLKLVQDDQRKKGEDLDVLWQAQQYFKLDARFDTTRSARASPPKAVSDTAYQNNSFLSSRRARVSTLTAQQEVLRRAQGVTLTAQEEDAGTFLAAIG